MLLLLPDGTHLPVTELPGTGPWTFLVLHPDPRAPVGPNPVAGSDAFGEGFDAVGEGAAGPDIPPAVPSPVPVGPVPPAAVPDPEPAWLGTGEVGRFLTRFGRAVVPDLRGRPGWGEPPEGPRFIDLVDDLDQVRTRAGLGRPVLVGLGGLAPVALRAATDQPWAWRALIIAPRPTRPAASADLDHLDHPALVLDAVPPPAPAGLEEAEVLDDGSNGVGTRGGVELLRVGDLVWERPEVAGAVERLLGRVGGGPGWAGIAPDAPPR